MSDAAKRTLAWREQKREEGYQPVTVWIPSRVKSAMVSLGFQRHQELGELIVEAFQAWSPAKTKPSAPLNRQQVEALVKEQVEALVKEQMAAALAHTAQVPAPEPIPEGPLPLDPDPAPALPPAGMKQCSEPQHAPYPDWMKECPAHVRERQARSRRNKAAARRGEVPAL